MARNDRPRVGRSATSGRRAAAERRQREERRRRLARVAALLVGVLILSGLGAAAFRGGDTTGSTTEPAAFDLPALDDSGGRVALADFAGKPLVVNFFASWCTACDFELPGFAQVSEELEGQVTFVGVNALETGDPFFMPERHGITWWPLARDVGGSNGSGLHGALGGGNSMPITAFYSAEGELLQVDRSALPERALRERLAELYGVDV